MEVTVLVGSMLVAEVVEFGAVVADAACLVAVVEDVL